MWITGVGNVFNLKRGKAHTMKTNVVYTVVLFVVALLALPADMTSYAAEKGWVKEGGIWKFLNNDGNAITREWKKSGSNYFWLTENGELAVNKIVEEDGNKYYVDSCGVRVVNQWIQVENKNGWTNQEDDEPETLWYYFGSDGKAVTGKKTINRKVCFFDDGGEMFFGWFKDDSNEKTYYLGNEDEGWAYKGWQQLELPDDLDKEYEDNPYEDGIFWFHFKNSGEMRAADAVGGEPKRAYINGAYYGFDENGVMVDGWRPFGIRTASNSVYYNEPSGDQPKGWVITYPNQAVNKEEKEPKWYYLDSKGRPFNAGGYYKEGSSVKSAGTAQKYVWGEKDEYLRKSAAVKYIDNKSYLFDKYGGMLYGVWYLDNVVSYGNNKKLKDGYYYFTDNYILSSLQGQMKKGKTVVEYEGESHTYYFDKKTGRAYTNMIVDGCLYKANGVRVEADNGNKKEIYYIDSSDFTKEVSDKKDKSISLASGTGVVVSRTGKLKKNGTVKVDGTRYRIKNYAIEEVVE